jgi:hypothetical protein
MPSPQELIEQIRQLQEELYKVTEELQKLEESHESSSAAAGNLKKAQQDLSKELEKKTQQLKEQASEFGRASQESEKYRNNLVRIGSSIKGMAGATASMMGILAVPTRIAERMGNMFLPAFEQTGKFERQIRMTSISLRAMSSEMARSSKMSEAFNKSVEDISKSTYLSREESLKLVSTLTDGMRGIRGSIDETTNAFTGQMEAVVSLSKMAGRLGLDYDTATKKAQKLADASQKMVEMQRLISKMERGEAGGKDIGEILKLAAAGVIDTETARTTFEFGMAGGKKPTDIRTVGDLQKQQVESNMKLAVSQDLTRRDFAQWMQESHAYYTKNLENQSEALSKLMTITKTVELLAGGAAIGGSAMKFAGTTTQFAGKVSSLIGQTLSRFSGKAGAAGQVISGASNLTLIKDAVPVWVTNPGFGTGVPGMGPGVPPGTHHKIPGGKGAADAAKNAGKLTKWGSLGLRSVPYIASLAYGFHDYKTKEKEYEERGLNKFESRTKAGAEAGGGVAGGLAGAAAGAAIGSFVPGIGTGIGSIIGGIAGYYGGSKGGEYLTSDVGKDKLNQSDAEKEAELAAQENAAKEDVRLQKKREIQAEAFKRLAWSLEQMEEVEREIYASVEYSKVRAGAAGSVAESAAGFGVGFGEKAAEQFRVQSEYLQRQSQSEYQAAKKYGDLASRARAEKEKKKQELDSTTDERERDILKVEIDALEGVVESFTTKKAIKEVDAFKSALDSVTTSFKASTVQLEKGLQRTEAWTEVVEAEQAYHKALR